MRPWREHRSPTIAEVVVVLVIVGQVGAFGLAFSKQQEGQVRQIDVREELITFLWIRFYPTPVSDKSCLALSSTPRAGQRLTIMGS